MTLVPLDPKKSCTHPQHNPPSHMVFPPGMGWKCPGCGRVIEIAQVRCGA